MLPAFFVLWNLRLEVKMFPDYDIRVAVAARDSTHHRRSIALQYGCSKKPPALKSEASRFLFFAGIYWWAMLGSNQRPLPCEGSVMVCWQYLEIAKRLQIEVFCL